MSPKAATHNQTKHWQALDAAHHIHPFTETQALNKKGVRVITKADGIYLWDSEGHRLIDGMSGLWCVNAGHCRPPIIEAIKRQLDTMDYCPAFQMGHPGEFRVAGVIADLAPPPLNRVFFANSGSEAVDSALKIALAYHRARGEGHRNVLIGRERGYHGVGFGGISVGGISANRKAYGSMLPRVDHLPHTHNPEKNGFSRGQPAWGAHLADDLERIVALHDATNIAAVIVEPVAGSTGVLVPPRGYLERLREICDKYSLLLIFDEVITAFGRTGRAFAAETFGVVPDMLTFAKGVTNATIPLSGVIVGQEIYDAVVNSAPPGMVELFHGYTYSGHPVATAAAEATLSLYHDEKLFDRAREIAPHFENAVHQLKGVRYVIDVRNFGLMAGIELEPRPGKPGARAFDAFLRCLEKGVLTRVTGDIIALSPPLIVEDAHIDQAISTIADVLKTVA